MPAIADVIALVEREVAATRMAAAWSEGAVAVAQVPVSWADGGGVCITTPVPGIRSCTPMS